jgi:hypothetical protein
MNAPWKQLLRFAARTAFAAPSTPHSVRRGGPGAPGWRGGQRAAVRWLRPAAARCVPSLSRCLPEFLVFDRFRRFLDFSDLQWSVSGRSLPAVVSK